MLIRTFGSASADRSPRVTLARRHARSLALAPRACAPLRRLRPCAALGNLHRVRFGTDSASAAEPNSEPDVAAIAVNVVRRGAKMHVQCFEKGREIRFCGSGVLAAIAGFGAQQPPAALVHGARTLLPRWRAGQPGFALRTDPWQRCRAFDHWQYLAGVDPVNVRVQPGYLLLEAKHPEAVAAARPRLAQLHLFTRRALILTAPGRQGCDYVMRYFAPQYGKPEDAATGSANALLMRYWAQKLGRRRLAGRQLSAAGGEFIGFYERRWVTLYGHAERIGGE